MASVLQHPVRQREGRKTSLSVVAMGATSLSLSAQSRTQPGGLRRLGHCHKRLCVRGDQQSLVDLEGRVLQQGLRREAAAGFYPNTCLRHVA